LQNQLIMQLENRVKTHKLPENSDYISPRNVHQELDYAEYIFTKGGFIVIEVSNKPVESTANEILTILTDRFNRDDWQTGKGIKY
jgi:[pyruvate, water dikinase]-phosphate phosphotransferase / [pyruvate, water dikinase] kinase